MNQLLSPIFCLWDGQSRRCLCTAEVNLVFWPEASSGLKHELNESRWGLNWRHAVPPTWRQTISSCIKSLSHLGQFCYPLFLCSFFLGSHFDFFFNLILFCHHFANEPGSLSFEEITPVACSHVCSLLLIHVFSHSSLHMLFFSSFFVSYFFPPCLHPFAPLFFILCVFHVFLLRLSSCAHPLCCLVIHPSISVHLQARLSPIAHLPSALSCSVTAAACLLLCHLAAGRDSKETWPQLPSMPRPLLSPPPDCPRLWSCPFLSPFCTSVSVQPRACPPPRLSLLHLSLKPQRHPSDHPPVAAFLFFPSYTTFFSSSSLIIIIITIIRNVSHSPTMI